MEYRDSYSFNYIQTEEADLESVRTAREHTDTVHAGNGPGYATLADALAAVPENGTIKVHGSVPAGDTAINKSVTIVGTNTGNENNATGMAELDASSAGPVSIQARGVTLRDLRIQGDKNGGDGLHVGEDNITAASPTLDNVVVRENGGDGVVFSGRIWYGVIDVRSVYNVGDGIVMNPSGTDGDGDSLTSCFSTRLMSTGNGGMGLYATAPSGAMGVFGNEFHGVVLEGNTGRAGDLVDQVDGNVFAGYGEESNDGGGLRTNGDNTINFDVATSGVSHNGAGVGTTIHHDRREHRTFVKTADGTVGRYFWDTGVMEMPSADLSGLTPFEGWLRRHDGSDGNPAGYYEADGSSWHGIGVASGTTI